MKLSVPILKTVLAQQPSLCVSERLSLIARLTFDCRMQLNMALTLLTFPRFALEIVSILCSPASPREPLLSSLSTGRSPLIVLRLSLCLSSLDPMPLSLTPLSPLTVMATLTTPLVRLTVLVTLKRTPWPPTPSVMWTFSVWNICLMTLTSLILYSSDWALTMLMLYRQNLWQWFPRGWLVCYMGRIRQCPNGNASLFRRRMMQCVKGIARLQCRFPL